MYQNAKWARENLAGVSSKSDAELQQISERAWLQYRVARFVFFGIGFFLIFVFNDQVSRVLFGPVGARWQSLLIVVVLGGLLGLVGHLVFQPYVRSHIRKIVDGN